MVWCAAPRVGDLRAFGGPARPGPPRDQDVEQSLALQLAGALESELPKDGAFADEWRLSQAPWVGRRYVQGAATARARMQARALDHGGVELTTGGKVSERSTMGSAAAFVETTLAGSARWEPACGQVTHAWTESLANPARWAWTAEPGCRHISATS